VARQLHGAATSADAQRTLRGMSGSGHRLQNPSGPSEPGRDLGIATRAATGLAYAVALAGAAGATLALRDGEIVAALVLLVVTLAVAALLAAVSTLLRSLERIEARLAHLGIGSAGSTTAPHPGDGGPSSHA
jgi:hypothetical protein